MMKLLSVVKYPVDRPQCLLGLGGALVLSLTLTACGGGGGGSPPAPRFSLVQTCVADATSGLTWQKLPGLTRAYADLATYVAAENTAKTCGSTDWRLPSVNELLSLMDASVTTGNPPNADAGVSGDRMTASFWTSETRAGGAVDAWQVDTANGAAVSYMAKTSALSVRLVRGSDSTPTTCTNAGGRFTAVAVAPAPAAGTVTDRVTNLMWKKCPEGFTDIACTVGAALSFTDQVSINARVSANNAPLSVSGLGFSDWRVPTRNELASLVNRTCLPPDPALIPDGFPNSGVLNFVSATVDADAPTTRVWSVNFTDGSIGQTSIAGPFSLRLVRTSP